MDPQQEKDIIKDMHEVKHKVSLMYYALVGNEMTADGGLIKRVRDVESTQEKHKTRMDDFDNQLIKMKLYEKLLWLAGGGLAAAVLNFIIGHL